MIDGGLVLFLAGVAAISLTGVVTPGPLLAVAIAKGPEGPHAGAWVGIGHGLVELPLIALIALGFGTVFSSRPFAVAVGLLGGLVLLYFGASIVRSRGRLEAAASDLPYRPVTSGAIATVVNPYFFLWWATIGAALVLRASAWGVAGLVLLGIVHWSCDLAWYWTVTAALARGHGGGKLPRLAYFASGLVLIAFGGWFLWGAARELLG